jgi:hypothetical protein
MSQKRYANNAARRKATSGVGAANRLGSRTPVECEISAAGGTTVTLDTDVNVVLRGFPLCVTDDGKTCTGAVSAGPSEISLTFDGSVAASTSLSFPFEDPAIRDMAGGYVGQAPITFPG